MSEKGSMIHLMPNSKTIYKSLKQKGYNGCTT